MNKNRRFSRWARRCLAALLCCATGSAALFAQGAETAPGKLKFVLVLSRHGVRSPTGSADQLNQYAAQPWPKWDVPPGNLTAQGGKLMTIFGGYYRSWYAQQRLFDATGCDAARTTSFYADSDQRTLETGRALAAGMFPGCSADKMPEIHAYSEGQADPLFHSLSAGLGKPDRERAVASIAGRIGGDPRNVTEAYRPQLEMLQRILLGCPPATPCPQPGHSAARLLLEVPATLDSGKSDHLADLKGPLATASTMTENLLLEYADGLPADQVGWGRVDLATLKQLIDLHTAASDLTRRTTYPAAVQASNTLSHILQTIQQAATDKPVPGALGKPGDRAVVLVGHDTNLANVAGMLNLNWLIDGRRDDTPPGGALVFELWQRSGGDGYEVHIYYTAQTLEQMRNVEPLSIDKPPARANVFIPACSRSGPGFPCEWHAFQRTIVSAIDPAFVK